MPYFRHRSFVFAPASASLSTPMICSSVNRRLFIRLLPDEQTLLHSGTNLGEQTTSAHLRLRTLTRGQKGARSHRATCGHAAAADCGRAERTAEPASSATLQEIFPENLESRLIRLIA